MGERRRLRRRARRPDPDGRVATGRARRSRGGGRPVLPRPRGAGGAAAPGARGAGRPTGGGTGPSAGLARPAAPGTARQREPAGARACLRGVVRRLGAGSGGASFRPAGGGGRPDADGEPGGAARGQPRAGSAARAPGELRDARDRCDDQPARLWCRQGTGAGLRAAVPRPPDRTHRDSRPRTRRPLRTPRATASVATLMPAAEHIAFLCFVAALAAAVMSAGAYAWLGRKRDLDVVGKGGHFFGGLGDFPMHWFMWVMSPLAALSQRGGLTADFYSYVGLVFGLASGFFIAIGRLELGGWAIVLSGIADALDGRIARMTGTASGYGDFIDSTFDRFVEASTFLGFG